MTDIEKIHSLPTESQPFADRLRQQMGRLLNIHARMAASPVVIAAYAGLASAITQHGTFDVRIRETLALAVGNQDGCDYCQAAHTVSARRAGFTDEQILQIRAGEITFDPKLAALAALARTAAAHTGTVPAELRTRALTAGWSPGDLDELFAHVALNLYTNYFNHYAGTELDFPAVKPVD